MTKTLSPSIRNRLLAVLTDAVEPIDGAECSKLSGVSIEATKGALSTALASRLIHVARFERCKGGKRFYYSIGPAPERKTPDLDPMEILQAMQATARAHKQFRRDA